MPYLARSGPPLPKPPARGAFIGRAATHNRAAGAASASVREPRLQLGSQRMHEALDVVRRLAAELASGVPELPKETEAREAAADTDTEPETEDVHEEPEPVTEAEEVDYSLFVPGPNGYELLPQTGIPPQAGQTVELVFPDREEPAVFQVARSGRTLPGGDICVYLAQV